VRPIQRDRNALAEPDGIEPGSFRLLGDPLERALAGRADLDAYLQRAVSPKEAGALLIRTNIGTSK
jgi:hypothetical protein